MAETLTSTPLPAADRPPAGRQRTTAPPPPRPKRARAAIYLALVPLLVIIGLFAYYPAASGVFWSFFDWNPASQSFFTGVEHYLAMFNDEIWWTSFRNLGIIFLFGIVAWVLPLIAAELLITLRSPRWQFVTRTLLILPMAFPGVVTALIWGFLYEPNQGVINRFLEAIGLGDLAHNWTGMPDTALLALLFVGFPFIAGLPFLIFYASLQNIPPAVLEAAQLDGVGRLRRFWSIDLPLMASQVRLLLFLAVVAALQYGFVAYVLTSGGPDNATMVPVLRMINVAFAGSDWGYAAALSTTLFVITLVLSSVVVFSGRRESAHTDGGSM
ncbi:carbohydrate ABC transporter permease [Plantibacter sp. VKM Ac-2876]|uniref:carbohydrate ABC transporter permease n=1 Tax=Plantibacter sp. VKM Ac-2876 TaxID=2783826 RepID=UPI00188BEF4C|nr:sugar ABC transporter permease [Plantibacter sp. VKM Ac-2876]MBF4563986.1 sugar ABC transporter permease [Plantibacter sp. VKM Ac-2876]